MRRFAIFVRRWDNQRQGFGRRRWLGHVHVGGGDGRDYGTPLDSDSARARAVADARRYLPIVRPPLVRSCDLLEAESDNGPRHWFGPTTPAPTGVGLL